MPLVAKEDPIIHLEYDLSLDPHRQDQHRHCEMRPYLLGLLSLSVGLLNLAKALLHRYEQLLHVVVVEWHLIEEQSKEYVVRIGQKGSPDGRGDDDVLDNAARRVRGEGGER